jgi:hypothetical protein
MEPVFRDLGEPRAKSRRGPMDHAPRYDWLLLNHEEETAPKAAIGSILTCDREGGLETLVSEEAPA